MTSMIDGSSVRQVTMGIRVDRATDTLPQTADEALFTISGGRVVLVSLVGEVTTAIQAQADNTKVKFNPDATGADQDLCAVLDITGDPIGELYTISGTVGDAMRSDLLIGNGVLASPLVLSEGAIELDCAASNTGSVAWTLVYVPLDDGAYVTAA
jgi:hypothetical protein